MQIAKIDSYHNFMNREPSSTPQPEDTGIEAPFVVDLTGSLDIKLLSYGPGLPHNLSRPDLNMQEGNRSLDDVIVQAFYPVADINNRLSSLFADKDKAVSQATRAIIGTLHTNEETTTPLEREEMRALAEAQARFIADNYFSREDSKEYLDIIGEIKSYADMSRFGLILIGYTSLEQGGKAVYKPKGTPEGYVPADAALEMNDEQAYRQWRSIPASDPKSMRALFSNMEKYQKSAYKTLHENLHTVNASASLDRLRSLDTSSLESFSHSFDAAAPSFSASQALQDSMTRFMTILL